MSKYIAFEVNQTENIFSRGLTTKERIPLATDAVEIRVHYSGVNYKDALATTKNGGVIRSYPMIPGIDLAGEIVTSKDENFPVGKKVLVTGYGLGVTHVGGYSQYQQVPTNWLVEIPETLDEKKAMTFGTAGFTAALAVLALEEKGYEKEAAIFVTGASGGVGSIAIALLHNLGYTNITAVSRKEAAWLTDIGATNIVTPEQIIPEKIKPLMQEIRTIDFSGPLESYGKLQEKIASIKEFDVKFTLAESFDEELYNSELEQYFSMIQDIDKSIFRLSKTLAPNELIMLKNYAHLPYQKLILAVDNFSPKGVPQEYLQGFKEGMRQITESLRSKLLQSDREKSAFLQKNQYFFQAQKNVIFALENNSAPERAGEKLVEKQLQFHSAKLFANTVDIAEVTPLKMERKFAGN